MKLYHFSDKEGLKKIEIKYFGGNSYTKNDANISSVKRAFYYDRAKAQEYLLESCSYRYTVEVDSRKIYDLTKDKENYTVKGNCIDAILRELKKKYIGVKYNNGFQCYNLFKTLTVKEAKHV